MSRKRQHFFIKLVDGSPTMEEIGPRFARLGLEPSVSIDQRVSPGDIVQPAGSNQRMVIVREIKRKERMERSRLLGYPLPDLPYCYIVLAD